MKDLFKQASECSDVFIENDKDISFFYLGHKITKYKDDEEISLLDIRIHDLYSKVKQETLDRFLIHGFEKTCDEIQIERDARRISIANHYIMKAILNKDLEKIERLQQERLGLFVKIDKLKNKKYDK